MGLKDTASLALIPAAYKTSKIYSALPTDGDGDFTFTRSGNATRVNKAGLVETMGTNIGRLNYDLINGTPASCPSLLLEPSRTNKQIYSQELSNSAYLKVGSTVTADQTTAPDGTLTADKVQRNTTSASYLRDDIYESTNGYYYSSSFFIKKGNCDRVAFRLQTNYPDRYDVRFVFSTENVEYNATAGDMTNGSYNIVKYNNGWYRIELTAKTASDNTAIVPMLSPRVSAGNVDSSDTSSDAFCYSWGWQTETSGNTSSSYPTSYIPTTSAAVTRTADSCGDAGNSTIIKAEGSLFVDFTTSNTDNFKRIYIISNSDFNNAIFIQLLGSSFAVQVVSGGTTLYSWGFAITLLDRHKIALRYKDGDSQLYYNGIQQTAATTAGTWFSEGLLNKFTFSPSGFFNFYGEINQAMVFNEALTDSELQTLTS